MKTTTATLTAGIVLIAISWWNNWEIFFLLSGIVLTGASIAMIIQNKYEDKAEENLEESKDKDEEEPEPSFSQIFPLTEEHQSGNEKEELKHDKESLQ